MDIVINHLTRMHHGAICMAGIDLATGRHVRPRLPGVQQLTAAWLQRNGGPVDVGCVLRFADIRPRPVRPETEDHLFFGMHAVQCISTLDADAFFQMLQRAAKPTLADVLGPDLRRHGRASCVVDVEKRARLTRLPVSTVPAQDRHPPATRPAVAGAHAAGR